MLLIKQALEYIFTRKDVSLKTFLVILQAGKIQWEYLEICAAFKKTEVKSKSSRYSCFPVSVKIVFFVAEFGIHTDTGSRTVFLFGQIKGHFEI